LYAGLGKRLENLRLNNFSGTFQVLGVDTEHLRLLLSQEIRRQVDLRQVC
jgi:hypothetical protein